MNIKRIIVLLTIICFSNYNFAQEADINLNKFNSLYQLIQENYADTVDNNKMIDVAIVKMLESLDPHSTYIPSKDVQKANEPLVGNFEGIGISYDVIKDTMYVVEVILGGPCSYVGVQAGDKLIKVNDTICAGRGLARDDYMRKLRGPKGTKVKLTFLRGAYEVDFTVSRDVIPIYSVDAQYMLNTTTGYIKISRFAARTAMEVQEAIQRLKRVGMKNLILDLQGNQGGYLNSAVQICDDLLDGNKLIVYTEGMHSPRQEFLSSGNGLHKTGKIIVLINENSASASEIVAGAIQDWDRGLILGRRSFGKGLVQKPFYLADGSVVRLTTAHYYTPSGRNIQKPYDGSKDKYYNEIIARIKSGQIMQADSVKFPDSMMRKTARGRRVYSGGGISPDIFVGIDTSMYSEYYLQLIRKGLLNSFVIGYLDKNRATMMQLYPTIKEFKNNYAVNKSLMLQFNEYGAANGVPIDKNGLKVSGAHMSMQLKALLARNLYSAAAYFEIYNELDPMIIKALELMEKDFSKYNIQSN